MTTPTAQYEVRILEKSKISRQFVDTLAKVSELVKGAQDKQICIYKIQKSSEGDIVGSEELTYRLRNNMLIFKTKRIEPFIPEPDTIIIKVAPKILIVPEPLIIEPSKGTRRIKKKIAGGLNRLQKTAIAPNSTLRKMGLSRAKIKLGPRTGRRK